MFPRVEEKERMFEVVRVGRCDVDDVDVGVVGEVCVGGVCDGGGGGVDVGKELVG